MNIIRRVAERLSHGKIIKRNILVNKELSPLYVSPDAQLKYLKLGKRVFDDDLINLAETYLKPDSNVWDIGANVGVFTFAAAVIACNGSIVSVEADIWLAAILRKTTKLKAYSNIDINVLPVAISNQNSIATFLVAARGRASNALKSAGGSTQMGGVREKQLVPTMTLDSLLNTFKYPDFVKIDVEGAELMALEGATRLMNDIRPTFYIVVAGNVSAEILDLFKSADYMPYNSRGVKIIDSCPADVLFIPNNKQNG